MPDSAIVSISVGDLARELDVNFVGDSSRVISGLSSFSSAQQDDLCFLQSMSYIDKLRGSDCGSVIVPSGFTEPPLEKAFLFSDNPQLTFVKAIAVLRPEEGPSAIPPGIHASAQVAETARLGKDVGIGQNCVIGEEVSIADGVRLGAGCVVERGCAIGANTRLLANVTLCHDVGIGDNVILHPGVVIGSDGFGLVPDNGRWIKVPHLGSVRVGNDVEIGANTTVDRGALDDTVIGNGVKLDNLIQVAHNVVIGDDTAIAACVGIAGSAIIGKNCRISGAAVVLGHLSVADNVTITAMSLVTKSIPESGTYSSGTPLMENRLWHRNNARYKMLDKLAKSVTNLEKKID